MTRLYGTTHSKVNTDRGMVKYTGVGNSYVMKYVSYGGSLTNSRQLTHVLYKEPNLTEENFLYCLLLTERRIELNTRTGLRKSGLNASKALQSKKDLLLQNKTAGNLQAVPKTKS
jgi:hypothetical protein